MMRAYLDFLVFCLDKGAALPSSVYTIDWKRLYAFASRQGLLGIFFCGLKKLPSDINVPKDVLVRWIAAASLIERKNKQLDTASCALTDYFASYGFDTMILKGQGNALMYDCPQLRSPGDIDILILGKAHRVIRFCQKHLKGYHAYYHHIEIPRSACFITKDGRELECLKDVDIEAHYRASFLLNPLHDCRLQRFFRDQAKARYKASGFNVPAKSFNIVFQLVHMYKHVLQTELEMKQLVDYRQLLLSDDALGEQEKKEMKKLLKHLGLYDFAKGISWVMIYCLGLEEGLMIVDPDEKIGKMIMREIVGIRHNNSSVVAYNVERLKRGLRLFRYFYSEICFDLFFRVWCGLYRIYYNLL